MFIVFEVIRKENGRYCCRCLCRLYTRNRHKADFVGFRFARDVFSKEAYDALKQTIEIELFKADIGVLIGGMSLNRFCFGLKYFVHLLKGE